MPASRATLTTTVTQTTFTRAASVVVDTYDTYLEPCTYLDDNLSARILADMGAPPSASLTCALDSYSILSSGLRRYVFTVSTSWTV
jgi:hypothetical protein